MKYSGVHQTPTAALTIHVIATRLLRYRLLKIFLKISMKNNYDKALKIMFTGTFGLDKNQFLLKNLRLQ